MKKHRNYNTELKDVSERKYAYNFDFQVMHPFMVESFIPFFEKGNLLELGSYKGDFTKLLLEHFNDITCVEASSEAIVEAKIRLGRKVKVIESMFETVKIKDRYNNVVMTHVLEHVDDPVRVLKRINSEWLAENGKLFLVVPNANAPSRQIAVKMGLVKHNTAVTESEEKHGHKITYTFDTLERDVVASGLRIVHRSGIFFKALANFQWDMAIESKIVSQEYLEGCYKLGQQYPEMCASIFFVCEKGKDLITK